MGNRNIEQYIDMVWGEINLGENTYYKSWRRLNKKTFIYRYRDKVSFILNGGLSGKKILDCGCGVGTETLLMALMGAEVAGIDVNKKRLKIALDRLMFYEDKLHFKNTPEFKHESFFDTDEIYDYIVFNESFHHIEPRERVFEHLDRITRPLSKVIFLETNGANPLLILLFFLKRGLSGIEKRHGVIYGKENIVSLHFLKKKMEKTGFSEVIYTFQNIFPTKFQNVSKIIQKIDQRLGKISPLNRYLSSSYIVLFEKNDRK